MGAINAATPAGDTVMVEPDRMADLLSQWAESRRQGVVQVKLEIFYANEVNEAVPVFVAGKHRCRPKR